MSDSSRVGYPPRRACPRAARITVALTAAAGLALLATACGGSAGTHVAQLATTTAPALSSGSQNAGGATNSQSPSSQMLAFSGCMRSNGVRNFPDPNSSGVLPKRQVGQLAASSPQFVPAHRACEHLLPNSGQPTRAQVQQAWNDMRRFARCMRSRGTRNWPDPSFTSAQDNRPFFNVPASIDPNAPQITAKMRACQHVVHANNPLVTTQ
jgi:hypothetical protein